MQDLLGGNLQSEKLQAGDINFLQGDPGEVMYVVEKGRVEIWIGSFGVDETVLGYVEPSRIFGEMALVDNPPSMASASAATATTLIRILGD